MAQSTLPTPGRPLITISMRSQRQSASPWLDVVERREHLMESLERLVGCRLSERSDEQWCVEGVPPFGPRLRIARSLADWTLRGHASRDKSGRVGSRGDAVDGL